MTSTWDALRTVLGEVHAKVRVNPGRVVGSSINDPVYNASVTALAITKLGTTSDTGRFIDTATLQVAQFAAARRSVLEAVLRALNARESLPRGFASDRVHMATVDFLVARGLLRREQDRVIAPAGGEVEALATAIAAADLFADERAALDRLANVRAKLTKKAVELR